MLTRIGRTVTLLVGVAGAIALPPPGDDGRQLVMHGSDELTEAVRDIGRIAADTWQAVQDVERRIEEVVAGKAVEAEDKVEELTVDAWQAVQGAFGSADDRREKLVAALDAAAEEGSQRLPWHHGPFEPIDLRKYTAGQVLNWTLHHAHDDKHRTLPIHKFAWLVNATGALSEELYDPKANGTLFAPSDAALTPPHRRHGQGPHALEADDVDLSNVDHPFWHATHELRKADCPHYQARLRTMSDDEKDRRERRRAVLRKIVKAVLTYHAVPHERTIPEILDSATLPTALSADPTDKKAPHFRIRVGEPSLLPFTPVKLNFFAELQPRPILVKNGVIYILEKTPLLPPLSPLSQLFLFPDPFSTLTSAVQKTGLAYPLLPHYGNHSVPLLVDSIGEGDDEVDERVVTALNEIVDEKKKWSKQSFTVFAPTNRAFKKLGFGLNVFLFSPIGSRILRYVLEYHVVPDVIFHTDFIANTTSAEGVQGSTEVDVPWPTELAWDAEESLDFPWPKPPRVPPGPTPPGQVNVTHYSLPTLLGSRANETLNVDIVTYRLRLGKGPLARRIVVKPSPEGPKRGPHGRKPVTALIADGVAWGGAVHVIPELIAPPIPKHHGGHEHGKRFEHTIAKLHQQS